MEIMPNIVIPPEELSFSVARSGGPGGQNVNKVNSKVLLRFDLDATEVFTDGQKARLRVRVPKRFLTSKGELLISSERTRDQLKNRQDCLEKLAAVLREGLRRPKTRIPTRPSRGSCQRRKKQKQERSQKKRDRGRRDWD